MTSGRRPGGQAPIRCGSWSEIAREQAEHLRAGVLVLDLGLAAPPAIGQEVPLSFDLGDGTWGEVTGRVVRHLGGGACAIELDRRAMEVVTERSATRARIAPDESPAQLLKRLETMSEAQRAAIAARADRPLRAAILRSAKLRGLHLVALRNPHVTPDEIEELSGLADLDGPVLAEIGAREAWARSRTVAFNVAKHPRTPPHVALRMLDRLSRDQLGLLAKGRFGSPAVQQAARRKVAG